MIANKLKGVPVLVDENRYRGGLYLTENFNPDIIIMDDGFQHRALHRDLDIVLIDGGDSISEHRLLPYGKLREPWSNIIRADAIIITKKRPSALIKRKLMKHYFLNYTQSLSQQLGTLIAFHRKLG